MNFGKRNKTRLGILGKLLNAKGRKNLLERKVKVLFGRDRRGNLLLKAIGRRETMELFSRNGWKGKGRSAWFSLGSETRRTFLDEAARILGYSSFEEAKLMLSSRGDLCG